MPLCCAIDATRRSVLIASHGYSTAQSGTARIIERSSSAICDGPSSPIEMPACEPVSFTLTAEMPAILMKSAALVRKHANVDAKGTAPRAASPIDIPTMTCSAMKFSKKRSAKAFRTGR